MTYTLITKKKTLVIALFIFSIIFITNTVSAFIDGRNFHKFGKERLQVSRKFPLIKNKNSQKILPESGGGPDHAPFITTDERGSIYLVWEKGNELWWATNKGDGWKYQGKMPGEGGACPVLIYDEKLLDNGTCAGLFCAWESITSPRKIISSVGKITGEGILWSEPQTLTGDSYDDYGLAMITDGVHQPLLLWLQNDFTVEDDSDLYYQTIPLKDSSIQWLEQAEKEKNLLDQGIFETFVPNPPLAPGNCIKHVFIKSDHTFSMNIGPVRNIVSDKFGYEIYGYLCSGADVVNALLFSENKSTFTPFLSSGLVLQFNLGNHMSVETNFFTISGAEVDVNSGLVNRETARFGNSTFVNFLSRPIPLMICLAPLGRVRIGGVIQAGAAVSFIGKNDPTYPIEKNRAFPYQPKEILATFDTGIGGEGIIRSWGNRLEGHIWSIVAILKDVVLSPHPVITTNRLVIDTYGWVGIFSDWNGIYRQFSKTIVLDPNDLDPNHSVSSFMENASREGFLQKASYLLETGEFVREKIEYKKKPFMGKGNEYEGKTVLKDISDDIYHDGLPSVAKSDSGEIMVVWTKGFPSSYLGTKVYAADYDGNSWSSPVAITPTVDFNQDTATAFDSSNNPMVVWSNASNAGLNYDNSSVEDIVKSIEKIDLMYARRIKNKWTDPQILAKTPGRDEHVSLSAGPCGEIIAVWANRSENESFIYGSFWDGEKWGAPKVISHAALSASPMVVYSLRKPFVIWTQDIDSTLTTDDDWGLYSSFWNGACWSAPTTLSFEKLP